MEDLLARVRQGEIRAIARLITRVENSDAAAETAVRALYPHTGQAHVVGITGAPGAGKSTLVNALTRTLRQREKKVGIVAVDPSSPFTGGALLGDRVRMSDLAGDRGVFIRSMASRGRLGGLAQTTAVVVKILDAAGYDVVLVETVGAGQAEVDIAEAAQTTVVIEAPGMGDDIQSIKAGILEIADILVVNKADRPGADRAVRSLQMMLRLGPAGGTRRQVTTDDGETWQIPVHRVVSTDGEGVDELVDLIAAHLSHLRGSGEWLRREKERSWREVEQLLQQRFMRQFQTAVSAAEQEQMIAAIARRETDPYTAVADLLSHVLQAR